MPEKVKDCDTTNGHVGPIARTLMKDARGDLIHLSGMNTPVNLPGIPRAGPTHFTSLLAAQSDLLSVHDSDRLEKVRLRNEAMEVKLPPVLA
jgi:hypothetical protein